MRRLLPLFSALALAAGAADAPLFFLGDWTITAATVAPWSDPAYRAQSAAEKSALVGKSVTFEAKRIRGPKQVACKKLVYKLVESTPDLLFQGELAELHAKDAKVDPAQLAGSLGFKSGPIRTLETGCANELDFHFVDDSTAEFGLNDYVYTLKRSGGAVESKPAAH